MPSSTLPPEASGDLELKRRLRIAEDELLRLHSQKGDLLSMVSHDIRAPLGVIVGAMNELSTKEVGELNQEQTFLLGLIRRSVERLTRLAANLVFLSRMERGKVDLKRRLVDLCPLVQHVIEDVKRIDASSQIIVDLAQSGPVEAAVDAERFVQVMTNLLSNAVRFARHKVDVTLAIEGTSAWVRVRDDGPGVPADSIARIFERFSRVDAPRSNTGLGLAIVRGIALAHGGEAVAENLRSEDGRLAGAQFGVRFPLTAP